MTWATNNALTFTSAATDVIPYHTIGYGYDATYYTTNSGTTISATLPFASVWRVGNAKLEQQDNHSIHAVPDDVDHELVIEIDGVEYCASKLNIRTRQTKAARFRQQLMEANRVKVKDTRHRILKSKDLAELRARETLRDLISEDEWRRYVTNGFVMAKGASGRWYQLFANRSHVQVYEKGKKVAALCIVAKDVPPTDQVLTLKTLVEIDEHQLWAGANRYGLVAGELNDDIHQKFVAKMLARGGNDWTHANFGNALGAAMQVAYAVAG